MLELFLNERIPNTNNVYDSRPSGNGFLQMMRKRHTVPNKQGQQNKITHTPHTTHSHITTHHSPLTHSAPEHSPLTHSPFISRPLLGHSLLSVATTLSQTAMSGERPAWHSSVAGTCGGMTALSTWFPVS